MNDISFALNNKIKRFAKITLFDDNALVSK